MKCPQCQTENLNSRKFCRKCGNKLVLICPHCSSENLPGDEYCGECGGQLRETRPLLPLDTSHPSSYTPKHLADQILTSKSALEGERKLVTVLFADVANYTALSEQLDPEEVHQILDGCFKILMEKIHQYEGTINQFTGDGVMALFGAPIAHEDHAQRACHAALSIQKAMVGYQERLKRESGIDFHLRIGLNSGPVVVGKIGDDLRMDYTAIGDTTNLASRMQGLASPGTILVSQHTQHLVQDFFQFQPQGPLPIKGKEAPQEAYQLLRPTEVETRIAASVSRGLTRFIGRAKELHALQEAYEKVQSGYGQVVGLVGEAGVGKSRLLWEFRSLLPPEEHLYLEGHCLHYGGSMAYLPLLDILRSYFEIREGDREIPVKRKLSEKVTSLGPSLKNILPPLQELLSLKVEDQAFLQLEPRQKRERTFEALRDLFLRESQNLPLILAIEELHWIDRTSEEFLGYLIDWLAKAQILLVLLYRPEYTHLWGSKSHYTKIGLDQLSLNLSAELVQAILEGGEVAPELRQLLLDRAAGNPLFVEELTHSLLENGSILKQDHRFILSKKPSDLQVPDTIQGIVAARMDRLEENLKRTMQFASVIGRDFAFRILQMITGMREDLKSHLLNLQGLEFIYEKALFPELEYIFKHALTQEVAYNSLLLKRKREIHERIGQAIEQLYAERLEEFYEALAYHYSRSENPDKAYRYLKLSGEKSMRTFATTEAFAFYQEALDLLKRQPDTEENKQQRIEVLYAMAALSRILGYPDGSLQLLQEGEGLSKGLEDRRSLVIFSSALGAYQIVKGNPKLGIEYSERSFQQAEELQDLGLMVNTGFDLCLGTHYTGQYVKLRDLARKMISLLEEAGREKEYFGRAFYPYIVFHIYYGVPMVALGDFNKAEALLKKGLRLASELGDRIGLSFGECMYGWLFVIKGDGENAIKHYQEAVQYSEETKLNMVLGGSWRGLGEAHLLKGDLESAKWAMEKSLQITNQAGLRYQLSWVFIALNMVHFAMGDLPRAQELATEALRLAEEGGEKEQRGLGKIWLGRILGKRNPSQMDQAAERIVEGIKILQSLKLKPWAAQGYFHLGQLYADAGQNKKALENLKKARELFEKLGMGGWLAQAQETLKRLGEEEA